MKKMRLIYAVLSAAAIILEILPYGAVLNFGVPSDDGSIETIRQTYSYFSLIPFGYANFGCFITALLTCVLLFIGILYAVKGNSALKKVISTISLISVLSSLSPFLFGLSYASVIGIFISIILILEFILSILIDNGKNCK